MRKAIILQLLMLLSATAMAQKVSVNFNNVTMPEALRTLNKATKRYTINFIFDDLEDFRVTTNVRNQTIPNAIRQVIGFYPIEMTVVGDSVVSVECSQKTPFRYTGRVVDEKGAGAEYANITLLSPTDSTIVGGGVSNQDGYFTLPCAMRPVVMRVTYVGYKTVLRMLSTPDAGVIRLAPDRLTLKQVTVKAQRPQYHLAEGGVRVDVENTILSQMGTATDVLSQLPRLDVKGTKVSVIGKGSPLIYINGRKMRDANELTQIKSEDIKSVEIITSPGAQYDATVGSVLRIRTKRAAWEGLSVRNDAQVSYCGMWQGYDQLALTLRTGKWEFSNNAYYMNDLTRENNRLSYHLEPNGETLDIGQHYHFKERMNVYSETFRTSFAINDSNSVGASYRYYVTPTDYGENPSPITVSRNGVSEGTVNMDMKMQSKVVPMNEVNVYYDGKLRRWSLEFNGTYLYRRHMQHQEALEESSELDNREVTTDGGQRSQLWAAKLVAAHPLWIGRLQFGTELTHTKSEGFYLNAQGYVNNSQTRIVEANEALFAQYNLGLEHWRMAAGVRWEHVSGDYYSMGVREEEPSKTYSKLFPNASVSYSRGLWQWQLAYRMTTERPSYRNLRDFRQYDSRFLYEGGNPYLKPQYTHNIELSMTRGWLYATLGYNYIKDMMGWTSSLLEENNEIIYGTTRNYPHMQRMYATVSASPKWGFYQPMYELDFERQWFHVSGITASLDRPKLRLRLNNRFQFGKSLTAAVNFTTLKGGSDDFQDEGGYGRLDLMVRKSFCKNRWMLTLWLLDITGSNVERWKGYGFGAVTSKYCRYYTQSVSLTLTYQLNARRSRYKGTGAGSGERGRL